MKTRRVRVDPHGDTLVIEWWVANDVQLPSRAIARDEVLRDPRGALLGADADWPADSRDTPIVIEVEDEALRDLLQAHPGFRGMIETGRSLIDAVSKPAIAPPSHGVEAGTRGFSHNSIESFGNGDPTKGSGASGKPPGWTNNG
jgi:hypothetical protein